MVALCLYGLWNRGLRRSTCGCTRAASRIDTHGTLVERGHTNPLSTSPAFQSDNLKFKGYEVRPNFEPPQLDYPAASMAQFVTAGYTPPKHI